MIWYVLIFMAAIGCAANFALTKVYQLNQGNSQETGIVFNFLVGIVGFLIYFGICGFKISITPFSLILAILLAVFIGLYTIIGFKIMSIGSIAVYTVFLMLGGMILPYFYGVIFLGEGVTLTKIIALLLMTAAIILQRDVSNNKGKAVFYLLCVLVFIINGAVSIVSKMHQIDLGYKTVSENEFVALKNAARAVMFGGMLPFIKKGKWTMLSIKPKMYIVIALTGLFSNTAYLLQLICAAHLPATVQFPITTGGTIIFTALAGVACFGEKLEKRQVAGLIICLGATILFVI
ncbi:MAG: EamA family transporter [Firmicutes bacterium]|nr:EamA family transporter [Bacillota bacterium]